MNCASKDRWYTKTMFFLKNNKNVLMFFILYYLLVSVICIYFRLHFVFSTLLFIVIPTAILILLKKNSIKEFTLFCFSLGVPMGIYTQVFAERNNMWKYDPVLNNLQAFGMPLEAVLWYPAWFGLVIATYLYFFDKHKHMFQKHFLERHFKYFTFSVIFTVISLFLLGLEKSVLIVPLPYITVILPVVMLGIILYIIKKHKHFIRVFVPTVLFLFIPMLLYDLIGVYSQQWTFPGHYLFSINFGIAKLPVEEFIIWLFLWPAAVIAYFEEFETDFK